MEKSQSKKLPFWAPPSSSGKCRVHGGKDCPTGCKYQSLNKKIVELSRDFKNSKALQDKKGLKKVWEVPQYLNERMKIMMTLNDAVECTFTPAIGSKMPENYKKIIKSEYGTWADKHLDEKTNNFEVYFFILLQKKN